MLNPWEEERPLSPECRSSSTDDDGINEMERQWLAQMRDHSRFPPMQAQPTQIFASGQQKLSTDFDLIRWALAYGGNVDTAVHKFRRHLRIREILHLDNIEKLDQADGLDVEADEYAPVDILGQISDRDRRILLLERSGRFQLDQMMQSIRTSSFMLNRFRLMERIRRAVQQSEQATGRRQSALLVMDLDGMGFQPALVSFISGAYRIMWGTLMEQYPSLLSAIIVLNCPTSVSTLWAACAPFVGEYRHRIHLLGRDWQQLLPPELLIVEALPTEYGGLRQCQLREPRPCRLSPLEMGPAELAELEQLSIPAGDFLVRTYFLVEDQLLQFVLGHEQELTLNGWMGMEKRLIRPAEAAESEDLEEVLAGCERPGMPTLDSWLWTVPRGGFFHLAFGNQKAWILAVPLKFQLFQLHPNGQRVKMHPIPASQLRALG